MDFQKRYFPDNNLPVPQRTDALKPLKRSDRELDLLASARGMLIARQEYQTKLAEVTEDVLACLDGLREGLAAKNMVTMTLKPLRDLEERMEESNQWAVNGLASFEKNLSALSREPSSKSEKYKQVKRAERIIEHLNFELPRLQKEQIFSRQYFSMCGRALITLDEETFRNYHSVIDACANNIEPLIKKMVEIDTAYCHAISTIAAAAPPSSGKSV